MFKSTIMKIEEMIHNYVDPKLTELCLNSHPSGRTDDAVICEKCGCFVDESKAIRGDSYIVKHKVVHKWGESMVEKIHQTFFCMMHDPKKESILMNCAVNGHDPYPEWSYQAGRCRQCGSMSGITSNVLRRKLMLDITEDEKYMLEHKDEFETVNYLDWDTVDATAGFGYNVIFNKRYSYSETKASSEGWIEVPVANGRWRKLSPDSKFDFMEPYTVYVNGEPEVARVKLFGEVIIFKLDQFGHTVKKVKDEI